MIWFISYSSVFALAIFLTAWIILIFVTKW
jgi:hypothetical protein